MNYYIKNPKDNNNVVELWSSKRLPFEPKGWLYDMRETLRIAISQLVVYNGNILSATYTSPIEELCDVENILFYNVGTGRFKTTCLNGFLLERSFTAVPPPPDKLDFYLHYQRYASISQNQPPQHWTIKNVLASWDNVVIPKLTSDTKPHIFWHLLKENPVSIFTGDTYEKHFGVEVDLFVSRNNIFNSAAIIKPMLDGIISAFHSYQGGQLSEVSKRLAVTLPSNSNHISNLLMDNSLSVLGSRRLLYPYQNNVQWNPADDKCVVIKLVCTYLANNAPLRMNGKLFAVTSK